MKKKILSYIGMAAMTLALGAPAMAQNYGRPDNRATNFRDKDDQRKNEKHPEIEAAIDALQKAKYHLEHAAHDFGGHRADALKSVDNALAQLRLALQYDKK